MPVSLLCQPSNIQRSYIRQTAVNSSVSAAIVQLVQLATQHTFKERLKVKRTMRLERSPRQHEVITYNGARRKERLDSQRRLIARSSVCVAGALCLFTYCCWFHVSGVGDAEKSLPHKQQRSLRVPSSNYRDSAAFPRTVKAQARTTSCEGKDGIMLIERGGPIAAFGAQFFRRVLTQLQYAEKHNLLPVIHFNNYSYNVWDEKAEKMSFKGMVQHPPLTLIENWESYPLNESLRNSTCPMDWKPTLPKGEINTTSFKLEGNGMWQLYFAPVPRLPLDPETCNNKILVSLDHEDRGDLIVDCWDAVCHYRYDEMSVEKQRLHLPFSEWIRPYRATGREFVKKGYYEIQPIIHEKFSKRMPSWLVSESRKPEQERKCLSMHIRYSDKPIDVIGAAAYIPFVKEYVEQCIASDRSEQVGSRCQVFLATDSTKVITEIKASWPPNLVERIHYQTGIVRTSNKSAVFDVALDTDAVFDEAAETGHHRTNTEIMLDIMGLSSCAWMVHIHSAVSESALYLNEHLESINLDYLSDHMSSEELGKLVIARNEQTAVI